MLRNQETKRTLYLPSKRHEPGEKELIFVDGMNLAYRAYYAYHKLSFKKLGKRIRTGMYYGMAEILRNIITTNCFKPERVIIFWDGDRHPKRLKILPEYKDNRKRMEPKERKRFLRMIERVRKMFYYMGVTQALNPKVEGDDMCYLLVKHHIVFNKILIYSSDKDFIQLVNHDVSFYQANRGNICTPGNLTKASNWGLDVDQIVDFLCLTGDKSDNIPGYRGIGEKRAAEFLRKFLSVENYLKDKRAEYPGLSDKDKLRQIWKRNRKLIDLKYFNEKYNSRAKIMYYRGKAYPKFNEEKFKQFCDRYNLKTFKFPIFIKQIKAWNNE